MSKLINHSGSLLILVIFITLAASEPIFPKGRLYGFSDYIFQKPIFPNGKLHGFPDYKFQIRKFPEKLRKVTLIPLVSTKTPPPVTNEVTETPVKTTKITTTPLKTTSEALTDEEVKHCASLCTRNVEYRPQCGTNGETFTDPCVLTQVSCTTRGRIKLKHDGICREGNGGPLSNTCVMGGVRYPIKTFFISKDCMKCYCNSVLGGFCKTLCTGRKVECQSNERLTTSYHNVDGSECQCPKYSCVPAK